MKRLVPLVLILVSAACSDPVPEDATGEEIFALVCARCHNDDLSGGIGPPLGPDSHAAAQTDDYLRITISRGRGPMPSFSRTLTPTQIDLVIAYIREVQSG